MVEGLTCFRVDIRQKEKSMVVYSAIDFFVLLGGDVIASVAKQSQLIILSI